MSNIRSFLIIFAFIVFWLAEASVADGHGNLVREANYLFQNDYCPAAIPLFRQIISEVKRDPSVGNQEKADLFFKLGFCLGEAERYDEGLEYYKAGIKYRPKIRTKELYKHTMTKSLVTQAKKEEKRNNVKSALDYLGQAEVLEENNPQINFLKGWVFSLNDLVDNALIEFRTALKKDISFSKSYIALGSTYHDLGKEDKAIFHFRIGLLMEPAYKKREMLESRINGLK